MMPPRSPTFPPRSPPVRCRTPNRTFPAAPVPRRDGCHWAQPSAAGATRVPLGAAQCRRCKTVPGGARTCAAARGTGFQPVAPPHRGTGFQPVRTGWKPVPRKKALLLTREATAPAPAPAPAPSSCSPSRAPREGAGGRVPFVVGQARPRQSSAGIPRRSTWVAESLCSGRASCIFLQPARMLAVQQGG